MFGAGSHAYLTGWAEGTLGKCHLPALLLQRKLCSAPAPVTPFPLLVNLSKCHLHVGSQWDQGSMPFLHKQQESQLPRVLQLCLVSNHIHHQNPM